MRKEIYLSICSALLRPDAETGAPSVFKHVDLWNRNVEFTDEEESWERPAVFVEFEPIVWDNAVKSGLDGIRHSRSTARLRLHIVSDWPGGTSMTEPSVEPSSDRFAMLDLCDDAECRMLKVDGSSFGDLTLVESHTNHDHEEIVEEVEVYSYRCVKCI